MNFMRERKDPSMMGLEPIRKTAENSRNLINACTAKNINYTKHRKCNENLEHSLLKNTSFSKLK